MRECVGILCQVLGQLTEEECALLAEQRDIYMAGLISDGPGNLDIFVLQTVDDTPGITGFRQDRDGLIYQNTATPITFTMAEDPRQVGQCGEELYSTAMLPSRATMDTVTISHQDILFLGEDSYPYTRFYYTFIRE